MELQLASHLFGMKFILVVWLLAGCAVKKKVVVQPPVTECLHLSGMVTMVYCDPPTDDCNTFTCSDCGKHFPHQ